MIVSGYVVMLALLLSFVCGVLSVYFVLCGSLKTDKYVELAYTYGFFDKIAKMEHSPKWFTEEISNILVFCPRSVSNGLIHRIKAYVDIKENCDLTVDDDLIFEFLSSGEVCNGDYVHYFSLFVLNKALSEEEEILSHSSKVENGAGKSIEFKTKKNIETLKLKINQVKQNYILSNLEKRDNDCSVLLNNAFNIADSGCIYNRTVSTNDVLASLSCFDE